MKYYFAYGSNMSREQLRRRCPSAEEVDIGYVQGYVLVFNRKGTYRPGGVASIERVHDPSSRVYGVIWRLSDSDFEKLDSIEDPSAYKRESLSVMTHNGETYECQVYIAFPQDEYISPDPDYLDLMLNSAIEVDLPESYIAEIVSFKSLPREEKA